MRHHAVSLRTLFAPLAVGLLEMGRGPGFTGDTEASRGWLEDFRGPGFEDPCFIPYAQIYWERHFIFCPQKLKPH